MTQNEQIRKLAEDNKDLADALKEKFPEAFNGSGTLIEMYGGLGTGYSINSDDGDSVAYIGRNLAPSNYRNKCIILADYYDWEFIKYGSYQVLVPRRK